MQILKNACVGLLLGLSATSFAQVGGDLVSETEKKRTLEMEASDSTYWDMGGTFGLNFNQSYFSNWAAGGQNAISSTALASLYAVRKSKISQWETTLDLAYGVLKQDNNGFIKTDDRIDLLSKYGYKLKNPKYLITALFNFRTQFRPGFTIENGVEVGDAVSDFLAPAFSILSVGLDYIPNEKFSAYIAPVSMKTTVVTIDALAPSFGLDPGDNIRLELGAFARMQFRDDIFENVNLLTRVDLFSNYLENPQNVDVNWETLITFKVNEWLNTSLTTQLIYDDDVLFNQVTNDAGVLTGGGPRTQFRQVFALGLSFKI